MFAPTGRFAGSVAARFPIRDADGNRSRIAGIAEDVTDREQAAELLVRVSSDFGHSWIMPRMVSSCRMINT